MILLKKAIFLIVSLFLLQVRGHSRDINKRPTPMQKAIEQVSPKLDVITQDLKVLKMEINKLMLKTFVDFHAFITKPQIGFLQNFDDFEDDVNQIIISTNKASIDIKDCINKRNREIEKILFVANNDANEGYEGYQIRMNNLTEEIKSIAEKADDIEKSLNQVIGYCIRNNNLSWQNERLLGCMFNEVDELNKYIEKMHVKKETAKSNITALLNETNDNNLTKWLLKIQDEFLECVFKNQLNDTNIFETDSLDLRNDELNTNTKSENDNEETTAAIHLLEELIDRLKQIDKDDSEQPHTPLAILNSSDTTQNCISGQTNKKHRFFFYFSFL